ncbi:sensor histidine kinase [Lapillicoccus jejuensis]|uniref:sensor histidine kinase n=1 Tax=Lapillicoccus jejuensis TaxID=402171 RepID=UPI0014775AC9|nr:histidine kinase [Lapillicoccus jejuensis]
MLTDRLYAWTRAHTLVVDAVIAVGILVTFGLMSTAVGANVEHADTAAAFTLLETALLVVRRRWPVPVMWTMFVLSLAQLALLPTLLPANIAQLYVIYTVAAHVPRFRTRLTALYLGLLGSALGGLRFTATTYSYVGILFTAFAMAVSVTLVWVVGNLVRGRESVMEQLAESNRVLQRDREQRDVIATQQERARIAREMHDIVAHSLSVVVVQADAGAYTAEHAAGWVRDDAVRTLGTIGDTARAALAETRRLVGVLRDRDAPVDLAPLAGLDDLDGLLERTRSSGVPVTAQVPRREELAGVGRDVELAAYRVVQESLTNVLKHAGPGASALVRLERLPDALRVQVSDDGLGAGAGDDGEGNGLVGMRERVTASGGTLLAGPRPGGGYAVTASLPLAAPRTAPDPRPLVSR